MEAATGFEPVIRALQARALPLGYAASMGARRARAVRAGGLCPAWSPNR